MVRRLKFQMCSVSVRNQGKFSQFFLQMPDVTAVQIQAARNPGTGAMPHPQSTRGGTGGGGGGGGGMHWASGNFRRSQSAASSKASSSPTSSRSAPASRHPPAPNGETRNLFSCIFFGPLPVPILSFSYIRVTKSFLK